MCKPLIPGGYFLTSRKIISSPLMQKPSDYIKVWIYLLSNAQHTDHNNLKRGQGFTSISKLIEVLSYNVGYRVEKPSRKKVWGIIEWLRNPSEGNNEGTTKGTMIETTKVTHGFVYTVLHYEPYQNPKNYEGNSEGNNEGTTKVQRTRREGNNKYKNVKNEENEKELTSIVDNKLSTLEKKHFDENSEPYKIAKRLLSNILLKNPNNKKPDMQKWALEVEKIIRIDKRKPDDIRHVLSFVKNDNFWVGNILSPVKLRKHYDTLKIRMSDNVTESAAPRNEEHEEKVGIIEW